eukprot:5708457-Prymnesium_polylepis.1
MLRRVAVAGAIRALRCRDWHEVRVGARTDRLSPCAVHVARRPVRACVATPVSASDVPPGRWPLAYDAPCGGIGRYARPAV